MSNATVQLPPERELPPGRQAAMRAQILRDIAGTKRGKTHSPRALMIRRRLLPLVAAAAVLLVIGATVGVLVASRRERTPVVERPDRAVVTSDLIVPGFTRAELKSLRDACVKDLRGDEEETSMNFGITPMREQIDVDGLQVYNAASDKHTTIVLLYTTDGRAHCSWDGPRTKDLPRQTSSSGYDTNDPRWIPGAASIEAGSSRESGGKYYDTFGGRVPASVTRIEATIADGKATATVVNGTYLVTVERSIPPTRDLAARIIRTYDRNGQLIGTYTQPAIRQNDHCVVTPSGQQIEGTKQTDLTMCTEALPWP
jgi:hypothetical protein